MSVVNYDSRLSLELERESEKLVRGFSVDITRWKHHKSYLNCFPAYISSQRYGRALDERSSFYAPIAGESTVCHRPIAAFKNLLS